MREEEMLPQDEKKESTLNAQPDRITPRHRALMRRLVAGMRLGEACADIGFSVSRASLIVNSPLFQEEMKRMEADIKVGFVEAEAQRTTDPVRESLVGSAEKAAKTLDGALSDENAMVRVSAAKDILDRAGYAKEDKLKAKVLVEPSQSLIDVMERIAGEKGGDKVNEDEG